MPNYVFSKYILSFFNTVKEIHFSIIYYSSFFFLILKNKAAHIYYHSLLKDIFVGFIFFLLKGYKLNKTGTFANHCNCKN